MKPFTNEELTEELAQISIVGFIIEAQRTSVTEESAEFIRTCSAHKVRRQFCLALQSVAPLLDFRIVPRKVTTKKVHKDVGEGLEIITVRLLGT